MPVAIKFSEKTRLKDFLKSIRLATRSVDCIGIPVVLDPGINDDVEIVQGLTSVQIQGQRTLTC